MSELPLFCDVAEEMRGCIESYNAGVRSLNGYKMVDIASLRIWADAMERASLIIEGPAE